MLEEQITGEQFPVILLQMAKAFSNIDTDDKLYVLRRLSAYLKARAALTGVCLRSEIDAQKLSIIFRKLSIKFTAEDGDNLFKQIDTTRRGAASFTELAVSFSRVDRSKIGAGLAEAFTCVAQLCVRAPALC